MSGGCLVKLEPFGSPLVIADQVEIDYGLSVTKGASIGENLSVGTDPEAINLNIVGESYLGGNVQMLGGLNVNGVISNELTLEANPDANIPLTIADGLKVGTADTNEIVIDPTCIDNVPVGVTGCGWNTINSSAAGVVPSLQKAPLVIKNFDLNGTLTAWMGFDAATIYSSNNLIKIKPAGGPDKLVRIGGNDVNDPYNLQITGYTDTRGVIKNTTDTLPVKIEDDLTVIGDTTTMMVGGAGKAPLKVGVSGSTDWMGFIPGMIYSKSAAPYNDLFLWNSTGDIVIGAGSSNKNNLLVTGDIYAGFGKSIGTYVDGTSVATVGKGTTLVTESLGVCPNGSRVTFCGFETNANYPYVQSVKLESGVMCTDEGANGCPDNACRVKAKGIPA